MPVSSSLFPSFPGQKYLLSTVFVYFLSFGVLFQISPVTRIFFALSLVSMRLYE